MLIDRASRSREDRVDRGPPGGSTFTRLCFGIVAAVTLLGATTGVEAQRAPIDPIVREPDAHPAFVAKLRDRRGFRAANWASDEDICPGTGELQHVRDYDGTLGQPRSFVDTHKGPVGRLQSTGLCTGTLIARNLFLTASHCVDDLTVNEDTVTFNREQLPGSTQLAPLTTYTVDQLVQDGADVGLDFAILRLADNAGQQNENPGDSFGITTIEPLTPAVGHLITIIQHPLGQPKQVEVGHVHSYGSNTIHYADLDTNNGSSGSGILDDAGRLVGVHTDGGCEDGATNLGVRMDRIVANSQTVRNLLPPTLLARTDRIRLLRVHDVGTQYGPPGDQIDVEAIVLLQGSDQAFGFTLRANTDELANRGMLNLLRAAYRANVPVRIEYDRETHRTNRILRVVRN